VNEARRDRPIARECLTFALAAAVSVAHTLGAAP
jgi:hypothetical protein